MIQKIFFFDFCLLLLLLLYVEQKMTRQSMENKFIAIASRLQSSSLLPLWQTGKMSCHHWFIIEFFLPIINNNQKKKREENQQNGSTIYWANNNKKKDETFFYSIKYSICLPLWYIILKREMSIDHENFFFPSSDSFDFLLICLWGKKKFSPLIDSHSRRHSSLI